MRYFGKLHKIVVFESDFEFLLEGCAAPIFIPIVFSPNNDGLNDVVFPQDLDLKVSK
jgi:hypothetical protein